MPFFSSDFYKNAQHLVEKHYLKPFPIEGEEQNKSLLKNGYIEREFNGAMHAARVCVYIPILHHMLKDIAPKIEDHFKTLEAKYNLNEACILEQLQYIGLCHDIAKQNEGQNNRGNDSTKETLTSLQELGITTECSPHLVTIIDNKHHAAELIKELLEQKCTLEEAQAFDYLRALLALANYFDSMRLYNNFDHRYAHNAIKSTIQIDKAQFEYMVFEFAKGVYQLLKEQGDLFEETTVLGPNSQRFALPRTSEDYLRAKKVQFEHSNNVLAAIVASMQKNAYFTSQLSKESPPEYSLYLGPVKFDPFIHGTSSALLPILQRAGNEIDSPLVNIRNRHITAMCGEITAGGFSLATSTGSTCFGRLLNTHKTPSRRCYTLDHILKAYAGKKNIRSEENTSTLLKRYLTNGVNELYSNINIIVILGMRHKQYGHDLSLLPEVSSFKKESSSVIGLFYLYMIVDEHLEPNQFMDKNSCWDFFNTFFSAKALCEKIQSQSIDLKNIYQNPTPKNLHQVLDLLKLPENATLPSGERVMESQYQLFSIASPNAPIKKPSGLESQLGYFYKNQADFSTYNFMMHYFIGQDLNRHHNTKAVKKSILNYIEKLENLAALFLDLIALQDYTPPQFNKEEDYFLEQHLPVIFVSLNEESVVVADAQTQEYRSRKTLILGKDISLVATDTKENKELFDQYFKQNNTPVAVVLASELAYLFPESRIPLEQELTEDDKKRLDAVKMQLPECKVWTAAEPEPTVTVSAKTTMQPQQPLEDMRAKCLAYLSRRSFSTWLINHGMGFFVKLFSPLRYQKITLTLRFMENTTLTTADSYQGLFAQLKENIATEVRTHKPHQVINKGNSQHMSSVKASNTFFALPLPPSEDAPLLELEDGEFSKIMMQP